MTPTPTVPTLQDTPAAGESVLDQHQAIYEQWLANALAMHPDQQFDAATKLAANVGYELVADAPHPDATGPGAFEAAAEQAFARSGGDTATVMPEDYLAAALVASPVRTDADGTPTAWAFEIQQHDDSWRADLSYSEPVAPYRGAIRNVRPLAALPPEGETGPAVAVKPLEWQDRSYTPMRWVAATSIGDYRLKNVVGGVYLRLGSEVVSFHPNELEAKAAAQADYDRRIRAALTVSPSPSERDQPLSVREREYLDSRRRDWQEEAIRQNNRADEAERLLAQIMATGPQIRQLEKDAEARAAASERDQHQGETLRDVLEALVRRSKPFADMAGIFQLPTPEALLWRGLTPKWSQTLSRLAIFDLLSHKPTTRYALPSAGNANELASRTNRSLGARVPAGLSSDRCSDCLST